MLLMRFFNNKCAWCWRLFWYLFGILYLFTTVEKFSIGRISMFLSKVFFDHYLIKNTVETVLLWNVVTLY